MEAKSRVEAPQPVAKPAWYRGRERLLVGLIGVLVAVALVGWFVLASARRKEQFAQRCLNQARSAAEAGNLPLASSELQRIITTYKGTDAASEAVLTLNQVRMVNGQSELAAVGLREYLASKPAPKYVAPANGLLGAALENAKRPAEAGDAYSRASEAADVDYLRASYLIDAGRSYRTAGRLKEAERAYRTVVSKYPTTPSFTEAQVRLAELTDGKM